MTDSTPTRRPYYGSCHCGHTRYICYLTLPPPIIDPTARKGDTTIKKCNCTLCHKLGFLHIQLAFAPDDFVLLSPTDPWKELKDYQTGSKIAHFFSCGTCGVQCFAFGAIGDLDEKVEIDLEAWLGKASEGKKTKVWRPKKEGYEEEKTAMLKVNATSLDVGQEGLDLREWHEKGWVAYVDGLDRKEEGRLGKPHRGGCY